MDEAMSCAGSGKRRQKRGFACKLLILKDFPFDTSAGAVLR